MRSNEFLLKKDQQDFPDIAAEAEKAGKYNGLSDKEALRLRLLAEELICMMPKLVSYGEGKFWVEGVEKSFELHTTVKAEKHIRVDHDRLLSISSDGKNAASKGIIGKICALIDIMMSSSKILSIGYDFSSSYSMGIAAHDPNQIMWSLNKYRSSLQSGFEDLPRELEEEDRDELERSIIANLADDVIVGIRGGRINVTVRKSF